MADSYMERRREPRKPASGSVTLQPDGGNAVVGELLDISASGFRARHADRTLCTGQQLRFEHATARGKARVMWNRIADGNVESGFLLINE